MPVTMHIAYGKGIVKFKVTAFSPVFPGQT
jgi:hypothetical protein